MALTHHSLLRLRCSTVRKGFAFPAPVKFESSEAMPRKLRGVASKAFKRSTESHRLSAVCGGKAALPSVHMLFSLAALLFVVTATAFTQVPAPTPIVSASEALPVPSIAVDYRADTKLPMPSLTRVGVDTNDQQPMSLREAIAMALQNNKDIEIARGSVKIAEFDLLTVRGAYDPKLTAQNYFEKINSPATSFLSGAARVETSDITATGRVEGLTPKGGGNYRVDFTSIRQTSNSQFSTLNPQYPTALTFTYTQPLVRGLRFDLPRRQIEIAKKNLSLTDAQNFSSRSRSEEKSFAD